MKNALAKIAKIAGFSFIGLSMVGVAGKVYNEHNHDEVAGNQAIEKCFQDNKAKVCSLSEYTSAYKEMDYKHKMASIGVFSSMSMVMAFTLLMLSETSTLTARVKPRKSAPKKS